MTFAEQDQSSASLRDVSSQQQQQQFQTLSLPDAWQMIQFEKRLDANTEGINKVDHSSAVERPGIIAPLISMGGPRCI